MGRGNQRTHQDAGTVRAKAEKHTQASLAANKDGDALAAFTTEGAGRRARCGCVRAAAPVRAPGGTRRTATSSGQDSTPRLGGQDQGDEAGGQGGALPLPARRANDDEMSDNDNDEAADFDAMLAHSGKANEDPRQWALRCGGGKEGGAVGQGEGRTGQARVLGGTGAATAPFGG